MSALPMPEQGLLGMPSFDMSEDEKKQALNMGLLAAGAGILAGNRGNYGRAGPAIGQGLLAGMQTYQGMNQQAKRDRRQAYGDQMQAEQFRMKQEEFRRQQEQRARMDGLLGGQGGAPGEAPTEIMGIPIEKAKQIYAMGGPEALQKAATEAYTLGDTRYVGASPLVTAQAKPQLVETADPNEPLRTVKQWMRPGETQGVQIGTGTMPEILDPRVQRAKQTIAKAGASNINVAPKIDLKAGESVAGQIGGILKDERMKTTGSVATFRNSQQLLQALDSNKVISGPLAGPRFKFEQIATMLGGGDKDRVTQTRTVMRGLAEQAVEARKLLAGQGQVTESEGAAVEKAQSGRLEDLTADEIRLIANLNVKAAKFQGRQFSDMLNNLPESAQQLRPMFELRGIDDLLAEDPPAAAPKAKAGAKFLGFE